MPLEWSGVLRQDALGVRLLIQDGTGHEVLRARLPSRCEHPRALLSLLEGLALYSGERLTVATSVAESVDRVSFNALFCEPFSPLDSALVRFVFVSAGRQRRIRGMGSFRELRAIRQRGEVNT